MVRSVRTLTGVALAATVALVVAGCSSGDDGASGDTPSISDTAQGGGAETAPPADTGGSVTTGDPATGATGGTEATGDAPGSQPGDAGGTEATGATGGSEPTGDAPGSQSGSNGGAGSNGGPDSTTSDVDSTSPNADLLAAAARALDAGPDGTVISIESENNDTQWEVSIVTADGSEFELDISRDGQSVIAGPRDEHSSDADKAKHLERIKAVSVDYAAAVAALESEDPDGRIGELELDTERGAVVWEADVYGADGSKTEYHVTVDTGEVTVDR